MYDYLNDVLFYYGRRKREGGTYAAARQIKAQGDVYLFNRLCREWSSRFVWTCPDKIMASKIEKTILTGGCCAIYRDELTGELRAARATGLTGQSYYGLAGRCTLVDWAGQTIGQYIPMVTEKNDGISNCVLVYDNYLGDLPINTVMYYYQRLSQISAQLSGALQNILGTQIIHADRTAMRDIERQMESARIGVPWLVSYDKDYDAQVTPIEYLQGANLSDSVKLLQESFEKTHHDFLVAMGVYANTEIDKKSGVSDLEITVNSEKTDTILETAKAARDIAVAQCKELGFSEISYKDAAYLGKTDEIVSATMGQNRLTAENAEKKESKKEET